MQPTKSTPAHFIVWTQAFVVTGGIHKYALDAYAHAERLARDNPGREFTVLRSVISFTVNGLETTSYL
jgi:hypothetical protein